ncbi:MAG: hypothetical protein M1812_007588 [Candelaria pacifica]|nr:MAG: hypothetical protein M1812_007588 [Candelaria pacifica]
MSKLLDDKSKHCVPFILECIKEHRSKYEATGEYPPPFFLGVNGIQGAGKTTLVSNLSHTLSSPPHNLPTAILSIDDLYLPHSAQQALASSQPLNPLIQHRGQPSTHDLALGLSVFTSLYHRQPTRIPCYDKSAFNGQGDRTDPQSWEVVNEGETGRKVEVVVFEGWCVGFRALDEEGLREKWEEKRREVDAGNKESRLGGNRYEDVKFINEKLRGYDVPTDMFDALIHIDAQDTQYVYRWRLEQEAALRVLKGSGMTDEQVIKFVDGYYPAYELYTDELRAGAIKGQRQRKQLRLIVGADRKVQEVMKL